MAKTDEKVMALVEKELEKNPDASVDDLYEKSKKAESSIGELSKRQFNARYPLQVKRRTSREKSRDERPRRRTTRKTRKTRQKSENGERRGEVRRIFLRFASNLTAAERRKELVDVLAGVDEYVEEVLETTDAD